MSLENQQPDFRELHGDFELIASGQLYEEVNKLYDKFSSQVIANNEKEESATDESEIVSEELHLNLPDGTFAELERVIDLSENGPTITMMIALPAEKIEGPQNWDNYGYLKTTKKFHKYTVRGSDFGISPEQLGIAKDSKTRLSPEKQHQLFWEMRRSLEYELEKAPPATNQELISLIEKLRDSSSAPLLDWNNLT